MDFLRTLSKIEPLSQEEKDKLLIEILTMLTGVMRSTATDLANSVRAADLLLKIYGLYADGEETGLTMPKLIEAASGQMGIF